MIEYLYQEIWQAGTDIYIKTDQEGYHMDYDCLIIDDEEMLAGSTAEYFNLFDVKTAVVYSVAGCHRFFKENTTRLVLLDINLGDGSGFSLCKELRQITDIPIIFISARTSDDDQIIALSTGGDDYVQKPYTLGVLLAKVKVVLKRYGHGSCRENVYSDKRLVIDASAMQVTVEGKPVKLTALEFKLLCCLAENKDRVVPKHELFEKVWEDKFTGDGTLNVHIRRIREAIEPCPEHPSYITTAWGSGYKFNEAKD